MKHLFLVSTALVLSACNPSHDVTSDHGVHEASAQGSAIIVSEARVRPPLPGRDVAAAYFTLSNSGDADQIVNVTTPLSEKVELHTHLNEDGVMKMRRVTAVDIPAHGKLEFKPGSYHVMIFGAEISDQTDDVSLTLKFVNADPVTLIAEIEGAEPSETMSHKGH